MVVVETDVRAYCPAKSYASVRCCAQDCVLKTTFTCRLRKIEFYFYICFTMYYFDGFFVVTEFTFYGGTIANKSLKNAFQ